MTDIRIEGGTLTASLETRVVSGLLVPYGEAGRTNLGAIPKGVRPGALRVPATIAHLTATLDHDRENPIASHEQIVDTPAGLYATYRVAATPAGDQHLADVNDPAAARAAGRKVRDHLSVEAKDIIIHNGEIVGGEVFGSTFCTAGAFPSASLFASDVGTEPAEAGTEPTENQKGNTMTETPEAPASTTPAAPAVPAVPEGAPLMASAVPVPATPVSPFIAEPAAAQRRPGATLDQVSRAVGLYASRNDRRALDALDAADRNPVLYAALEDVGLSDVAAAYAPQWLGEVWDSRQFTRRVVPLLSPATLTAPKALGFKWTTKPEGDAYAGDKANVPTNVPVVAPVEVDAERWAMGHDIDRAVVDFGLTDWFAGYARLGATDYSRYSEARAIAELIAQGTTVEAGNPGDALPVLGQIVDGSLAIMAGENVPSFAAVSLSKWRELALASGDQVKTALAWSLGLDEGQVDGFKIIPHAGVSAGNVLVGAGEAASFFELPGSPIRTTALDQIRAGVDEAMFGYFATLVTNATAFQLVTPYTP